MATDVNESMSALDLPSWYKDPRSWQQVQFTINGQSATFFSWPPPGAKVSHKLDVKDPRGKDGATLTHVGVQPSRVQIELLIWTGSDEKRWNEFYPTINPKMNPSGRVRAQVSYPSLARAKIGDLLIYDVEERLGERIPGALTVKIEALEARRGKDNVTTTPKKPGSLKRPNAFDQPTDIRQTADDPAKETAIK